MSKEPCDGNGEGDFCPACLSRLENWSVQNPDCETCDANVYRPIDYEDVKAEKYESAQIEWNEALREIF